MPITRYDSTLGNVQKIASRETLNMLDNMVEMELYTLLFKLMNNAHSNFMYEPKEFQQEYQQPSESTSESNNANLVDNAQTL
nr:15278_t:CDS:2 [Entrophospora candida]